MRKSRFYKRYRPKVKRKKSIFKNRFFWISCLVLVILGVFFYFLFFSSFFQVKKIIISGNERVSEKEIQDIIQKNLKKRFLFFSTESIFLTNLNKVKKDILSNFPQISDIEISRRFPDVLNIIVLERIEVAKFCRLDNCFSLSSDGVIFKENQSKENLIEIEDKREIILSFNLGQKIIEKENLEKILKIQKYISEEFEFGIKKFILFNEKLVVQTTENWEIYFNLNEDLDWQLTKLDLVLKEKIPSQKRRNLEYIELRFGDLATYKLR